MKKLCDLEIPAVANPELCSHEPPAHCPACLRRDQQIAPRIRRVRFSSGQIALLESFRHVSDRLRTNAEPLSQLMQRMRTGEAAANEQHAQLAASQAGLVPSDHAEHCLPQQQGQSVVIEQLCMVFH